MIQGIIFDFDNTLYDYDISNNLALTKVFEFIANKFNLERDLIENKYNQINKLIKESNNCSNKFNKSIYFKQLLEELNILIYFLQDIINIYNEFNNLTLYDNVLNFIKFVKKSNIMIGILSNNNFIKQYDKLVKLELIQYIDFIQTSDEVGYEKPNKLIYLSLLNKMKLNPENVLMIGDNYHHDIIPALNLGLIPFHFNSKYQKLQYNDKYFEFGNYKELLDFFKEYLQSQEELIYLSKLFGQSVLNIQGQGGNISVKTHNDELILIKSSGKILANMDNQNGFCVADNIKCNKLLKDNNNNLNGTKIFGQKIPSMETFFHSFMKKYTVHLHFTLSNIFLITNQTNILDNLTIEHKIIDYFPPGIILANEIYKVYDEKINIYFLKNHGLIITSDNLQDIETLYCKIFRYFNNILDNMYSDDLISFDITQYIYKKFNKMIICKKYDIDIDYIQNIKYCFPDLAVYVQKIKTINNLHDILDINDIIIFNNKVFILSINLTSLYCIVETLDKYKILCNNFDNLITIDNTFIKNMEEEKYRKSN
jgi:putative hydrolase of the HAD superfamily